MKKMVLQWRITININLWSHNIRKMQGHQSHTIQEKFAQYYNNYCANILPPSSIKQREFGFILFEKKIMLRHKSFKNGETLKTFLASTAPSDAYYSAAYYERTEADMDKKGWLGADLVFDIDADHIPTPCNKIHDRWTCNNCRYSGRGPSPEKCPACGEAKFETKTWTCDDCLESAKKETVKLVDMLMEDFGFAGDEIRIYFSGNRGYHVHVENENIRLLDSMTRKEIVDYVIGLGFKAELHKLIDRGKIVVERYSTGWRGRIAKEIHQFLTKATSKELEEAGLAKNKAELIAKNQKMLLERWESEGWLGVKDIGTQNWMKIIQQAVDQQSAKIDTVVTTDIHRLIRLAGSLHGKTGFMKVEAPFSGFEKFDPLKEAVVFREGQVVVDVVEAPEFRIEDTTYGPFKDASGRELPTAAALYLLCSGVAKVVE